MKITSVWEFLKTIEEIPKKRGSSSLYFRGHSNSAYKLEPSLFRHTGKLKREHLEFREQLKEKPDEFREDKTTLEKLTKMQHFGISTRLLDITTNPLVALYFACIDRDKKTALEHDGEVVILALDGKIVKYNDSDTAAILSNLCKLTPGEKRFDTSLPLEEFNKTKNTEKLLEKIREEKPHFRAGINPKHLNSVVPVKAPKNNKRIRAQNGLFLLFGVGKGGGKVTVPDSWVVKTKSGEQIIIDAKSKSKIRKQLEKIGISNNTLSPERYFA